MPFPILGLLIHFRFLFAPPYHSQLFILTNEDGQGGVMMGKEG